jgi:hypothetical protein
MEPIDQPEGYATSGGEAGAEEQGASYLGESSAPGPESTPEERAPGAPEGATASETETREATEVAGEAEHEPEHEPESEPELHGEPSGPRIQIDVVGGDFSVRGGSRQVVLHAHGGDADEDEVEDSTGTLRFAWLPGDSELQVPDGAEIEVRRIEGDLDGRRLDGILVAHHVAGDVTLEDMAAVELLHVDGDYQASHCGAVRARMVMGDARVANLHRVPLLGTVAGDLRAEHLPGLELRESVGGDVTIMECGDVSLLGTVGGDLHVERSVLTIRASAIGGDARLGAVRAATIAAVGGDLKVSGAPGAIEVSSVGGDVHIRHATALVRLGTVGGDLDAQEVRGGVIARRIGGDATLETSLGEGAEYEIHAAGDISLRVRGEVNARFVAQTFGGEIRTRLPLTVEKGRRRNLVGVLGRGDATVTLRSDGGDISLAATDRIEEEHSMGDEFVGRDRERDERSWEGSVGGRRFRVSWDRGPGRAGFRFQGPFGENEDPDAMAGGTSRDFNFEWEKGQGPRMSGEYEERLNEMRDRAERVARRAAEEAQRYAEKAARRARETDWEAVGREVRSAIEKAMGELEDTFNQVRHDWETRRPTGTGGSSSRPSAQRVKIEYDDDPDAAGAEGAGAQASASRDDADAQRRAILEQLRAGTLSLDEAERRLNDLR